MRFLPYENFFLLTKLSPTQVESKLTDNTIIRPINVFRIRSNTKKAYEGSVSQSHFEVASNISYRNSFLPIIHGKILPQGSGSRIHIRIQMNLFITGFMVFYLGYISYLGIGFIKRMVEEDKFYPGIIGIIIFFALGYGLMLTFFKLESKKSKKFFAELFQANNNLKDL